MLFLLAIEPLHLLFKKAQDQRILKKLPSVGDALKILLYADAAALFINPNEDDLHAINSILQFFVEASRLKTNLSKTQFYPIQCEDLNLDFIATMGHCLSNFPCIYLGLPLNTRKPSSSSL
jgi:hypothetical protein